MGLIKKFKDYFLEDDYEEYEEEYVEEEEPQQPAKGAKQNVVSLQSVQKSSKVVLIEPRAYAEAQEIADHLKNRRAVVVNLQRIPHDQAKRIVDFLSGTVYAIGGDIQQVGTKIFLCTPDNVDVSGTISAISDDETTMKRW
ncbi:cell division protein SepF [Anoxybacteroides amylolyticum]|uniref:Cell division protein SepF n=1 Tax=Anoxybacteroides amylolyticum TaxID=294699 RepID=A0A167TMD3_9BACL|nr:cell division protein SepF [Anoxybacillus amylolyticus]ANB61454.1 cell division protein sepF [Anoxybacillus amylolyticus]